MLRARIGAEGPVAFRVVTAGMAGAGMAVVTELNSRLAYAPAVGWITAAAVYLLWTWTVIFPMDAAATREHADRLLRAFEPPGPVVARRVAGPVDPLSARELDVLRLLSTDLDGPAIARELVVSLNTLRTHTKNIYAKLGVNNRRAAVRQARELDLLRRTGTR